MEEIWVLNCNVSLSKLNTYPQTSFHMLGLHFSNWLMWEYHFRKVKGALPKALRELGFQSKPLPLQMWHHWDLDRDCVDSLWGRKGRAERPKSWNLFWTELSWLCFFWQFVFVLLSHNFRLRCFYSVKLERLWSTRKYWDITRVVAGNLQPSVWDVYYCTVNTQVFFF